MIEDLKRDWGDPDIYGPWTTDDDWKTKDGIKFFKSYYLISTNETPNIDILKIENNEGN